MSESVGKSSDQVGANVIRNREVESKHSYKNIYEIEVVRDGKVIRREVCENIMPLQGLRYLLDVAMNAGAGTPDYYSEYGTWYVALVESNTTPDSGMTYATPTYTECTAYDEATRPEWVQVTHGTNASITNPSTKATFTINATKTLYGASIVSSSTKGNTNEANQYLISYALFGSPISVVDNDVVNVTCTISLS